MGRNLSPALRRELANLEKDGTSRKSAMKALKSYVKDLDSKAIPLFLAQVSETKDTGSLSGEYTISLYEVLARFHGPNIVSQIDSIMTTIIKTLASSAGSFPLQQACSKVVPAIARYGIDPTTSEDKKRHIIDSLCKPLSDALLGSQECLTSGASLCLNALVDTDNWRFASYQMVNRVCQNVSVALGEKSTQTNVHMALVTALAKKNALVVEAYARLLVQSGLRILNAGIVDGNSHSQKRLSAVQMVNSLMKCLDPMSLFSELELIIKAMENCQADEMAFVRGAAFEALQTAKKITMESGPKFEKSPGSVTCSNFSRRDLRGKRIFCDGGDISPASLSPESRTMESFIDNGSFIDSPTMTTQGSPTGEHDCGSVNRKHWSGCVDISLRDGLFSELAQRTPSPNAFSSISGELSEYRVDNTEDFLGFLQRGPRNRLLRSATPSPQRSRSRINVDNIDIFTTPRKLIHSLQDPTDNLDFCANQNGTFHSPCSSKFGYNPTCEEFYEKGCEHNVETEIKDNGTPYAGPGQVQSASESVSSTDDVLVNTDVQVTLVSFPPAQKNPKDVCAQKSHRRSSLKLIVLIIFVLVPVVAALFWIGGQDNSRYLIPT